MNLDLLLKRGTKTEGCVTNFWDAGRNYSIIITSTVSISIPTLLGGEPA